MAAIINHYYESPQFAQLLTTHVSNPVCEELYTHAKTTHFDLQLLEQFCADIVAKHVPLEPIITNAIKVSKETGRPIELALTKTTQTTHTRYDTDGDNITRTDRIERTTTTVEHRETRVSEVPAGARLGVTTSATTQEHQIHLTAGDASVHQVVSEHPDRTGTYQTSGSYITDGATSHYRFVSQVRDSPDALPVILEDEYTTAQHVKPAAQQKIDTPLESIYAAYMDGVHDLIKRRDPRPLDTQKMLFPAEWERLNAAGYKFHARPFNVLTNITLFDTTDVHRLDTDIYRIDNRALAANYCLGRAPADDPRMLNRALTGCLHNRLHETADSVAEYNCWEELTESSQRIYTAHLQRAGLDDYDIIRIIMYVYHTNIPICIVHNKNDRATIVCQRNLRRNHMVYILHDAHNGNYAQLVPQN